jgi:hypothetical protein
MSLGYAEKLKPQEDYGGSLGTPELSETPGDLREKVEKLVALVRYLDTCQAHVPED